MRFFPIPVDGKTIDWPRRVANSINELFAHAVVKDGATIYPTTTLTNPPTQAELQAMADALAALSERLK